MPTIILKFFTNVVLQKMEVNTKAKIIAEWAGSEANSGSVEAQVGLITERVRTIAKHLESNHKDHSSRRGLLKLLGKRRKLISYIGKKDAEKAKLFSKKIKA